MKKHFLFALFLLLSATCFSQIEAPREFIQVRDTFTDYSDGARYVLTGFAADAIKSIPGIPYSAYGYYITDINSHEQHSYLTRSFAIESNTRGRYMMVQDSMNMNLANVVASQDTVILALRLQIKKAETTSFAGYEQMKVNNRLLQVAVAEGKDRNDALSFRLASQKEKTKTWKALSLGGVMVGVLVGLFALHK